MMSTDKEPHPIEIDAQNSDSEQKIVQKRGRKRQMSIFVMVCLLNVGLIVLLWTQLMTPRAKHSPDDSPLVGEGSSPLIGKTAPDFTLPILGESDKQIHLAALKGKPVILNFWGSWCVPCQEEAPLLQKTWSQIQPQGAVMIGIDIPEANDDAPLNFIRQYGLTYTNVKDNIQGSTGLDYRITGQPETFFIDRNGVVVAHWFGPLTANSMRNELAKLQLSFK
jgi:cytochrome c biogenesis protein CcmG/thiol:disulfide interchange protein DsbE